MHLGYNGISTQTYQRLHGVRPSRRLQHVAAATSAHVEFSPQPDVEPSAVPDVEPGASVVPNVESNAGPPESSVKEYSSPKQHVPIHMSERMRLKGAEVHLSENLSEHLIRLRLKSLHLRVERTDRDWYLDKSVLQLKNVGLKVRQELLEEEKRVNSFEEEVERRAMADKDRVSQARQASSYGGLREGEGDLLWIPAPSRAVVDAVHFGMMDVKAQSLSRILHTTSTSRMQEKSFEAVGKPDVKDSKKSKSKIKDSKEDGQPQAPELAAKADGTESKVEEKLEKPKLVAKLESFFHTPPKSNPELLPVVIAYLKDGYVPSREPRRAQDMNVMDHNSKRAITEKHEQLQWNEADEEIRKNQAILLKRKKEMENRVKTTASPKEGKVGKDGKKEVKKETNKEREHRERNHKRNEKSLAVVEHQLELMDLEIEMRALIIERRVPLAKYEMELAEALQEKAKELAEALRENASHYSELAEELQANITDDFELAEALQANAADGFERAEALKEKAKYEAELVEELHKASENFKLAEELKEKIVERHNKFEELYKRGPGVTSTAADAVEDEVHEEEAVPGLSHLSKSPWAEELKAAARQLKDKEIADKKLPVTLTEQADLIKELRDKSLVITGPARYHRLLEFCQLASSRLPPACHTDLFVAIHDHVEQLEDGNIAARICEELEQDAKDEEERAAKAAERVFEGKKKLHVDPIYEPFEEAQIEDDDDYALVVEKRPKKRKQRSVEGKEMRIRRLSRLELLEKVKKAPSLKPHHWWLLPELMAAMGVGAPEKVKNVVIYVDPFVEKIKDCMKTAADTHVLMQKLQRLIASENPKEFRNKVASLIKAKASPKDFMRDVKNLVLPPGGSKDSKGKIASLMVSANRKASREERTADLKDFMRKVKGLLPAKAEDPKAEDFESKSFMHEVTGLVLATVDPEVFKEKLKALIESEDAKRGIEKNIALRNKILKSLHQMRKKVVLDARVLSGPYSVVALEALHEQYHADIVSTKTHTDKRKERYKYTDDSVDFVLGEMNTMERNRLTVIDRQYTEEVALTNRGRTLRLSAIILPKSKRRVDFQYADGGSEHDELEHHMSATDSTVHINGISHDIPHINGGTTLNGYSSDGINGYGSNSHDNEIYRHAETVGWRKHISKEASEIFDSLSLEMGEDELKHISASEEEGTPWESTATSLGHFRDPKKEELAHMRSERDRKVFIQNLPINITAEELRKAVGHIGPIEDVRLYKPPNMPEPATKAEKIKARRQNRSQDTKLKDIEEVRFADSQHNRSAVHAFVTFADDKGYRRAVNPSLQVFGVHIKEQNCRVEEGHKRNVLFLEQQIPPKPITEEEIEAELEAVLEADDNIEEMLELEQQELDEEQEKERKEEQERERKAEEEKKKQDEKEENDQKNKKGKKEKKPKKEKAAKPPKEPKPKRLSKGKQAIKDARQKKYDDELALSKVVVNKEVVTEALAPLFSLATILGAHLPGDPSVFRLDFHDHEQALKAEELLRKAGLNPYWGFRRDLQPLIPQRQSYMGPTLNAGGPKLQDAAVSTSLVRGDVPLKAVCAEE